MRSDQFNISNVSGQIGAIGANAKARAIHFHRLGRKQLQESNFRPSHQSFHCYVLNSEVATDIEHDKAVASIGSAEVAAKNNDGEGVLKHLKAAGKWTLDTATKIGTQVAVKAIENAIKLP